MSLQTRVSKLEDVSGINEPCEVCEASKRLNMRLNEMVTRLGIVLPKSPPAKLQDVCSWCLRPVALDLGGLKVSERVIYERMSEAYEKGTICLPENSTLRAELDAAFEREGREMYGQHYDQYMIESQIFEDEVAEISRRRVPRRLYLCCVPGCACSYPKTEDEYHRNAKASGIAA
jgi:hypothetical protein